MNAPDSKTDLGRRPLVLGALLFLFVAGVFLPAVAHDFITYDDPRYVTENPHVVGGLTWANIRWAFQSTEASNWHPLTWLSHMADCQVFGLHPWGHHLTNVLLHALNAALLFIVLRKMSGSLGCSFMVAALFGVHPLHVESVAWVAERKDVLSTFFWMLVLWAYARRAELARKSGRGSATLRCYGWALIFFALGLMCKPMLVTLPCVLLLLDYWPLNRWCGSSARERWALVAEKIPFLALSAASSAITLFAQGHGEAIGSVDDFPWPVRLANALISCCRYLGKCFVPVKLAVFYPFFAERPPRWETALAGALLAAITAAALLVRKRPYLLVGWFWFLGTLVPVIGLVQIGGQSMADRYSYVPLIGVFIMATWGIADATASWPHLRRVVGLASGAILAGCAAITSRQLSYWRNGADLFRHALVVTTNDNWVAHANLYATLSKSSPVEAEAERRETLRILASFAETHERKGVELERTPGHSAEAIDEFRTAVRIMRDLPGPHYNLGTALAGQPGHLPEAIEEFRTAVRLWPDYAEAYYNLAAALETTPESRVEAVAEYEKVIELKPDDFKAHFRLGRLLSSMPGRKTDAIAEYQTVIRLNPDYYPAHYYLGFAFAGIPGRRQEAIGEFEAVVRARPDVKQAREMIDRLEAAPP
jgi:Flp pilus assembly protein TadD